MIKAKGFFTLAILFFIQCGSAFAEAEVVPGEVVIKFKKEALTLSNFEYLQTKFHFKLKRFIPNSPYAVVKMDNKTEGEESLLAEELMSSDFVEIAEPNFIYNINKNPNDPEFGKLWGLSNTGTNDPRNEGNPGVDVSAIKAWEIQTGNPELVVGVIDTGVDYNHEDLKDNMWVNLAEKNGKAGVDDDGNGYVDDIYGYDFYNKDSDPMDDHGHGSHCSGTIGAKGNNKIGITGIAWNVKIMAIKIFSSGGRGGPLDGVLEAIRYATKMGAKITNNSWGGGEASELLKQVIQEAGEKGVLFVAAAGNEKNNNDARPSYPASYPLPNVISVAAVDNRGDRADFSNYGMKSVHVAAPGVGIYSVFPSSDGATTGYSSLSGTSMATPHVTGIAALLLSNEPQLTPLEVRQRLISTSKPMPGLKRVSVSKGMVDAYNALTQFQPPPDANDPAYWVKNIELNISSQHPYQDATEKFWEVEVPGANEVALYFQKVRTEEKFDKIILTNRKGDIVEEYTGSFDELWTSPIKGDYVKVTLRTDKTKNDYGFDLNKVVYR